MKTTRNRPSSPQRSSGRPAARAGAPPPRTIGSRSRLGGAAVVLAGDIGGTKTNVGLFELPRAKTGRLALLVRERFSSREHGGLREILSAFLTGKRVKLRAAAFGIAGPVISGRSSATNLPWVVDASSLSRTLRVPVALLNDIQTTAHSIPSLDPDKLRVLNAGRPARDGTIGLIAAGTGLGEGFVLRREGRFVVGASEGGHCSFAPRTPEEIDLLRYLAARYNHVSVERLLSGPGLVNIFEFLGSTGAWSDSADLHAADGDAGADRAATIAEAGLNGASPHAAAALRLFASIYGSEAGNVALMYLATGGIYIGGGIAPKILPAIENGTFMRSFLDKGRFRALLSEIPVHVILDDQASLFGAAAVAASIPRRS